MLLALLSLLLSAPSIAAPLPALRLDPEDTTISGISSGAFMATQLQVAFSSDIHGLGSVAGGIYGCAEGTAARAQMQCMLFPGTVYAPKYVALAKEAAAEGRIDSLSNLKKARVYLFHSEEDGTVLFPSLDKLRSFMETFVPKAQVKVVEAKAGAHAFPTLSYGKSCDTTGSPFIVACKRDVAGEILGQLYPGIKPPAEEATGELVSFDQSLYAKSGAGVSDTGYVYVPKACRTGICRLHIALHGCKMNADAIKAEFREHAGYNRWADTNRLVVLYPDAARGIFNPNGCWDWFGYTGADYAVKSGRQMDFFAKMLGALKLR